MDELSNILSSMRLDLAEITFPDASRNHIYLGLRSFCEKAGNEKIADTGLLRKYLLMAGTPKARQYLDMLDTTMENSRAENI